MTDKHDPSLSFIRSALADAEDEVTQALQRFQERTGLAIVDVEIQTVTSQLVQASQPMVKLYRVRLQPQSI